MDLEMIRRVDYHPTIKAQAKLRKLVEVRRKRIPKYSLNNAVEELILKA